MFVRGEAVAESTLVYNHIIITNKFQILIVEWRMSKRFCSVHISLHDRMFSFPNSPSHDVGQDFISPKLVPFLYGFGTFLKVVFTVE